MSKAAKKKFSEETQAEVGRILSSYSVRESAILPVLHVAQREFGCVDEETLELVAGLLGISAVRVAQTMSFYTMFATVPRGKHVIQVCNNISCSLLGSESVLEYLEKRLGVKRGSTRQDGLVTLKTVECLGSCGTAPVMMINDKYYESLTLEKVEAVLAELGI